MKKLTFLGDVMCDGKMASTLELYKDDITGEYDFGKVFLHLSELLSKSDYVIANLETPLSRNGDYLTKKRWEFNTPYQFAKALMDAGVDFVSTANNHCLDRGIDGLAETTRCLDEIGMDHGGTSIHGNDDYKIITLDGLKVAVLVLTYGTNAFSNHYYLPFKYRNSVNLLQEQEGATERAYKRLFRNRLTRIYYAISHTLYPGNRGKSDYEKETLSLYRKLKIIKTIRRVLKAKPDFLVAYLHIGGQYNKEPSDYTKKVTDWFIRHRFDAVIDNHEHVIHPGYWSSRGLIAYALGNCLGCSGVSDPPFDRRCEYSIALHVYLNEDGEIINTTFSVLRTIMTEQGLFEVWPVVDLKNSEKYNRWFNQQECLMVAHDFSSKYYSIVREEFDMELI